MQPSYCRPTDTAHHTSGGIRQMNRHAGTLLIAVSCYCFSVAGTDANASIHDSAEPHQICLRGEKAARWVMVPIRKV